MIAGRCPICGTKFETPSIDEWPGFPFCSERCKMVDLGRWMDGAYGVAIEPGQADDEEMVESDPED